MEYEVLQKVGQGAYGVVWIESKCEGYGVHVWANGDRYEGEWKEHKVEGCREV